MTARAPERPRYVTGWCGQGEPEWAHRRCREVLGGVSGNTTCTCPCHTQPPAAPAELPEAAISAAAEAICRNNVPYDNLPDTTVYRLLAVAALQAALPHLDGHHG